MAPLASLSLLVLLRPSAAWGPDGHTIVAHIAQQLLTPDVNKTVSNLLGIYELSNASDWCDSYDHSPEGQWSASLHFIDYPGNACSFTWADCPDDWCNAGAIANYTKQVADTTLSFDRRAFALRFILHMMGDIHQPLHVSRTSDEGGNLIKIGGNRFSRDPSYWLNQTETLHSQWDSNLVAQVIYDLQGLEAVGPEDADVAPWKPDYHNWWLVSDMVVKNFKGNWSSKLTEWSQTLASTSDETAFRAGLAEVAVESATRGCTYAYADVNGSPVNNGTILSREYYERAKPIVVEQLAKGGARLAQVLNSALKASSDLIVV